jgi:hypothetical protein
LKARHHIDSRQKSSILTYAVTIKNFISSINLVKGLHGEVSTSRQYGSGTDKNRDREIKTRGSLEDENRDEGQKIQ